MSDYSNFPFGDFTVAEVFALARESKEIGDDEFVKACMGAIRLNKCAAQQSVHLTASGAGGRGQNSLQSSFIADDPSAKHGGR